MTADFYAQVARLEEDAGTTVGGSTPAAREPVRFVASTSLGFEASELVANGDRELVTSFLGLSGGSGALPPYLLEEIEAEDERPVRRALLAPFHHRAVSLLHRSVFRCRVPDSTRAIDDAWPTRLGAMLAGEVSDEDARRLALLVAPLLFGRASARSLARGLLLVAEHYLGGARIVLRERTGRRVTIAAADRSRLSATRLGDTAMLGGSVADPCHRASIVIGPVDASTARSLAADGPGHRAIAQLVEWLAPVDVSIELEIVHVADRPATLGGGPLGRIALGRAGRERTERVAVR